MQWQERIVEHIGLKFLQQNCQMLLALEEIKECGMHVDGKSFCLWCCVLK